VILKSVTDCIDETIKKANAMVRAQAVAGLRGDDYWYVVNLPITNVNIFGTCGQ
jgi:hypothetical protein